MKLLLAVVDRTAVLFLGVAAGVAIGFAFADGRGGGEARDPALTMPPIAAAPAGPAVTTAPGLGGAPSTPAAPKPAPPPEVAAVLDGAALYRQQVLASVAANRPIRVGVFGDSFGDGVWSGLNRLLPRKAGFEVVKYSQQATGFTRYKALNLENHAAEQLGAAPLDVAVISYGANDTQGVITSKGKYAALLGPLWQAEIGGRVDRFVALMRSHGAMVYWVGLPRMRKTSFDSDIQAMNAFYARKMAALGVPFIDTRPFASGPEGEYAPYLADPRTGTRTLIRADDGIHMSMNGYVWITRDLAGRIRAYVDAARTMAGSKPGAVPAPAPPPVEITVVAPPPKPVDAPPVEKRPRPKSKSDEEKRTADLNRAVEERTRELVDEAEDGSRKPDAKPKDAPKAKDAAPKSDGKRDAETKPSSPPRIDLPKGLVPEPEPKKREPRS